MLAKIAKVVFIGNSGTGKTSALLRRLENTFSLMTSATIGTDFLNVSISDTEEFQVFDTAGREKLEGLGPQFYRGVAAFVLFLDRTKEFHISEVEEWVNKAKDFIGKENEEVRFYVAINKCDLEPYDKLWTRERVIKNLKSVLGTTFDPANVFYCSAKDENDKGIDALLEKIAADQWGKVEINFPSNISPSTELTNSVNKLAGVLSQERSAKNIALAKATQKLIDNAFGQLKNDAVLLDNTDRDPREGTVFDESKFNHAIAEYKSEINKLSPKQNVAVAIATFLSAFVGFVLGVVIGAAVTGLNPVAALAAGTTGAIVGGSIGAALGGGTGFCLSRFWSLKVNSADPDPVKAQAREVLHEVENSRLPML